MLTVTKAADGSGKRRKRTPLFRRYSVMPSMVTTFSALADCSPAWSGRASAPRRKAQESTKTAAIFEKRRFIWVSAHADTEIRWRSFPTFSIVERLADG